MNLLGSAAYDPAAAVSKATSALLAMTAIDTTNLRLAITVPAHGKVLFRMACTITGATTLPAILLGVMNGATILKRQVPQMFTGTQSAATQDATARAEFVVTGLTPGALNADAAYGVQVLLAATNIKFGGPNDTTGNDAWGAFVFEAWDPQPLTAALDGAVNVKQWNGTNVSTPATAGIPDVNVKNINNVAAATPGASGGILISGSNSGTTTLAALTVTGVTTHTGNVVLSDGLTISAPSTGNRAGLDIAGNGTGAGIKTTGGATGVGISVIGGGTSGDGIKVVTTSGHGMNLAPVGASMHGLLATGGNSGTSDGIKAAAGTGGVDLRAAITGNVTGSLSGSVGSVTGAVGSVTGAVASVTGNVGGNVVGSVASVTARVSANTDQLAGQTVTAAAGVTFPTSVASPTNITGGTITTTTNTTNAPTVGDFTAAMKTSLNAATPAVTVSDKTGFALTAAYDAAKTAAPASDVTAIKGKTDSLTFSVAGKVDSNVKSVKDTTLTGAGTTANPWNP